MNVPLYRCEEDGCEAAFLAPNQLKGHMSVHAEETLGEEASR